MRALRIGLVGTRFAGFDGVTLESIKVAEVLESLGHSVSWFGGRLDSQFSPGLEVPDAYFDTVTNLRINHQVFGSAMCPTEIHDEIEQRARALQMELARYVNELGADVLMPQNALAIPMHLPLGVAIARHVAETQIPTVSHHHDFGWERSRFWPNAVGELLNEAFPPSLPNLGHLVINTLARDELARRRGIGSRLLPNIMDFETPPAAGDSTRFRLAAGLSAADVVLLQPTRMVPRKGIEDTFELARRLNDPSVRVVVTHPEPDEGAEYVQQLELSAARLGVDFRVVPVGGDTGIGLADAYAAADLVTYPSRIEGFGNALLEAFYFKRPLLVNRYPVYAADIEPLGVAAIEMDGSMTVDIVAEVSRWLSDRGVWAGAVEQNYEIGLRHFSYGVAAGVLTQALDDVLSVNSASTDFGAMVHGLMRRHWAPSFDDPSPRLDRINDVLRFPAAFLISLCGEVHPRYRDAAAVLGEEDPLAGYFRELGERVRDEIETTAAEEGTLRQALQSAAEIETLPNREAAYDRVWAVTFPEGVGILRNRSTAVAQLRQRRRVEIEALNPYPIIDPLREVLFTANVLVAPNDVMTEPTYWYDHPIPVDTPPAETELAHGLRMFNTAVAYERIRHPEWTGPATVALSISSTHEGHEASMRDYVESVVAAAGPLENLSLYVFDERLCRRLWDEVVAVRGHAEPTAPGRQLVFGVSGPYGRHYTFLKAIAALWAVCIDANVRGTFKFDLDQSFPEVEIVAETDQSALEHLTTSRWGARGRAASGEQVDFAMIAGGLVNQEDGGKSIFTPDIKPALPCSAEDAVFFSPLVQAVSTEGEIVSRYDDPATDGVGSAQERIHVTGGTTGILVGPLRRWRLFTPTTFGRAEDQAYLLSALGTSRLRPGYMHEPGLVMRHDKVDLIPDVIQQSANSKHIGDLVRMRLFSTYAAPHKSLLDPFTGCFISRLPITVAALRFVTHALGIADKTAAGDYLAEGMRRLREADASVANLPALLAQEREQWNRYYNSLDLLESGLASREGWALQAKVAAGGIISEAAVGSDPVAK